MNPPARRYILISGMLIQALPMDHGIAQTLPPSGGSSIYLSGGIASHPNALGANASEPYEFDSLATANYDLLFNGITATPILLPDGISVYSVTGQWNDYTGLGLFFTSTNTLVNTFGAPPDLYVYTSGTGFEFADAGTQVATIGQFSGNQPYSGAVDFTVGEKTVTVTEWTGNSLTLNVIPEPATTLLLLGGLGLLTAKRKRR